MRLRSHSKAAAGQHPISPPRQQQTPAVAPPAYTTAYNHGTVSGLDGQFDHFVRTVHPTHIQTGYWRFSSNEDDRRAHARGFSTPEDILADQDRSGESYTDISLRWVPGSNETNMKSPLVGSAGQHLRIIYEVRQLLGMPISLRGDIPLYPVGEDVRLRQFWEDKARQQSRPLDPGLTSSPKSGLSIPKTKAASSSLPDLQKSPESQHSGSLSRHDANPAAHARRTQGTAPASERLGHSNPPWSPIVSSGTSQKVPGPFTAPASQHVALPSLSKAHSAGNDDTALSSLLAKASKTKEITASVLSQSQKDSRAAFQGRPELRAPQPSLGPSYPPHLNGRSHPPPHNGSEISAGNSFEESPSGVNTAYTPATTRSSSPYTASASPAVPPQYQRDADQESTHNAQKHPINDLAMSEQPSQRDAFSASSRSAGPKNSTNPIPSPSGTVNPTTNMVKDTNSADNDSNAETSRVGQSEPPTNSSELAPAETQSSLATTSPSRGGESALSTQATTLDGVEGKVETIQAKQKDDTRCGQATLSTQATTLGGLKGKAETNHAYQKDDIHVGNGNISPQVNQLPSQAPGMYPGLPCMDCGEDEGHKWDCHIGNLKPTKSFTVVDHRTLADAVGRFDPGPWTTHFDQFPQPKPEDPQKQIQGMAEIIRNEDTYKNDPALHGLPDDAMIMLWAFKTSPGVEVIEY